VPRAGAIGGRDTELLARAGSAVSARSWPALIREPRLVARERGLEVVVRREDETGGYRLLTLCNPQRGHKIIAGTVFDGQPRTCGQRDLDMEFTPEGYILVFVRDQSGVVGRSAPCWGAQRQHRREQVGAAGQARRAIVI